MLYKFFVCLLSFLPYFLLTYLLLDLSSSLRIGPFDFQAGGHKRLPNLALGFLCLFYVVVYFVTDTCFFCCVRFGFSILGWEERVRNDLFWTDTFVNSEVEYYFRIQIGNYCEELLLLRYSLLCHIL